MLVKMHQTATFILFDTLLLCLHILIVHLLTLLNLAVLQNPEYLLEAVRKNRADMVEHALSLGLNAAETDNVCVSKICKQAFVYNLHNTQTGP